MSNSTEKLAKAMVIPCYITLIGMPASAIAWVWHYEHGVELFLTDLILFIFCFVIFGVANKPDKPQQEKESE